MQCMSCNEEVSEKFLHALTANSCPFCGSGIMPEELRTLLNNLAVVMCDLETKAFLPQAEAWLKQNFDLLPAHSEEYQGLLAELEKKDVELAVSEDKLNIATKELTTVKQKLDNLEKNPLRSAKLTLNQEPAVEGTVVQVGDQITTNAFMKRADASKLVAKSNELKKVADKIKVAGGLSSLTVPMTDVVEEFDEAYEEEELESIAAMMAAGGVGTGNQSGGYNAKDVQLLKNLQAKQRQASRGLSSGGVGLFSRGG